MPSSALNNEQTKELHAWLLKKGFVVTNLGQRYADATEISRLLKLLYPRRVELHNYSSCSSTPAKLSNWNTLNFKVLSKLQIKLSKNTIEELAKGVAGTIESLLFRIMTLEKTNNEHIMKCGHGMLSKERSSKEFDLSKSSRTMRPLKSYNSGDYEGDGQAEGFCTGAYGNNTAVGAANGRQRSGELPPDEQKIIAELCRELHIENERVS